MPKFARRKAGIDFTKAEDAVIRELYPSEGSLYISDNFLDRTVKQINRRAGYLDIKCLPGVRKKNKREADEMRRLEKIERETQSGPVERLAYQGRWCNGN